MKKFFAIGVAVLGLMIVGCNSKPSLVGKWKGEISAQGQSMPADIEFKPDGKMITVAQFQQMTITGTASYKVDGDKMTSTMDDIKISGLKLNPTQQAMFDAQLAQEKGKSTTSTFVFKDADTVEVSDGSGSGAKMTWKRQK
jgi:hypothetical protein